MQEHNASQRNNKHGNGWKNKDISPRARHRQRRQTECNNNILGLNLKIIIFLTANMPRRNNISIDGVLNI
jgi:hypothetical protein